MRTYSCQLNHSRVKEFHVLFIWDHPLVEAATKGWLVLLRVATAPSPLVRRAEGRVLGHSACNMSVTLPCASARISVVQRCCPKLRNFRHV